MKKFRFLAIAMATVLTFGLVSCGEDKTPYEGIELNDGEFIEIESLGFDTTASYPVHFKVILINDSLVIESMSSTPTEAAMQIPGMNGRPCFTQAGICDYGEVRSLGKIDEYPSASSLKIAVKAIEKHGYVVEAHGVAQLDAYHIDGLSDIKSQYMRIWLEEATETGFKLRYEFPFLED